MAGRRLRVNTQLDRRWPEVEAWLDRVLDQPGPARRGWLDLHCQDPILRRLVSSLLDADAAHGARLEAHAAAAHDRLSARAFELPQVPGYRLLRLIGEGGMASVFLAERLLGDTVQRVAVKRLRLNVFDRDERRRFEHEHRILARLEHPHIARLVDAGIAPDGIPWFAMEHVEGEPLVAWCDARKLGIDARLALMEDVAAAVHHAHQHLVVHRDLKPANILVNGEGVAKVLDFGIARLLDPDTGDGTRTAQRRLTPGYAAPEQYAGQASTATDVYALGVVLVELLSGQRPTPSAAPGSDPLRGLAATDAAAQARATTPRALARLLSGDVGAVARKALREAPELRYGSAQAFADDLAAIRARRPVSARRGEWRYRAGCFVRRNKAAVGAGVLVAVTLVAATGVSLTQAHRAREQAERAQAVQAFVEEMLAPLREGVPRARMPSLDQLLAQGVARLDRSGGHDPAVYSELLVMFARTYDRMGDIDTARTLAERAYRHSAAAFGEGDARTIEALAMRGRMHARFGDRGRARADLEAAREGMRRGGIEGLPLAMVLDDLGGLALDAEDGPGARALFEAAQRQRMHALPSGHPDLAIGPANLAEEANSRGDKRAALGLVRQAFNHCATHGSGDSREAALYLSRSGLLQCELGYFRAGSHDYMRALAIFDRLDERDHPERMWVLAQSCSAFNFLDELDRAQGDCDRALAMAERLYGAGSNQHGSIRLYRLKLMAAQGRLREGHAEAAELRAHLVAGGDSQANRMLWLNRMYSDVLAAEGDPEPLRDALVPVARHQGFDRWTIAPVVLARLMLACARAPSIDCPSDLPARLDAEFAELQYRDNPLNIDPLLSLARLALHRGHAELALRHLDETERLAELPHAQLRPEHRWRAEARLLRGEALAAQGHIAGAQREWRAAEAALAPRYAPEHPLRRQLATRLGPGPIARR